MLGHQVRGRLAPSWPGGGRDDRPADNDGAWVAWRLVGSNHRELARSATVLPTTVAAGDAVALLRAGVARAAATTEAVRGLWTWQLSIDDVPVAVASRLYQRPRECAYNLAAALAAIPIADLADALPRQPRAASGESTVVDPAQLNPAQMDWA